MRAWCEIVFAGSAGQPLGPLPMQSANVSAPSAPARKCVTAVGP